MDLDPKTRMTLSDARAHPWLAEQAAAAARAALSENDNEEQGPVRTQPSQDEDLPVELPPETQYDSQAASSVGPEVSMRSLGGPSHLALGLMSVDLGTKPVSEPPQPRSATLEGEGNGEGRIETPPHVDAGGDFSAQEEEHGDGGSQPHTVQRRADVIRRAQHKGIELPAPSQLMEERAAADSELDVDVDVGTGNANAGIGGRPGERSAVLASRADGKGKATGVYPESPVVPSDDTAKPAKAVDTQVLASVGGRSTGTMRGAPKRGREGDPEDGNGNGNTAAVDRSPSAKKARTSGGQPVLVAVTSEEVSEADAVPGVGAKAGRRRSSRLEEGPSTKPKSARKT